MEKQVKAVPEPNLDGLNIATHLISQTYRSEYYHSQFGDGDTETQRDSSNLPVVTQLVKWMSQV